MGKLSKFWKIQFCYTADNSNKQYILRVNRLEYFVLTYFNSIKRVMQLKGITISGIYCTRQKRFIHSWYLYLYLFVISSVLGIFSKYRYRQIKSPSSYPSVKVPLNLFFNRVYHGNSFIGLQKILQEFPKLFSATYNDLLINSFEKIFFWTSLETEIEEPN